MAGQQNLDENSGEPTDPLLGFNFRLEIEGHLTGWFTECSGIGSEHEVIDHTVVDKQGRELVRKIPGRLKWGDVTLKRGITDSMDIWAWRKEVEDGQLTKARADCSIIMMSRQYQDVARWEFKKAWPSKVTGPDVKADGNEYGVEELVIVHEGLIRSS